VCCREECDLRLLLPTSAVNGPRQTTRHFYVSGAGIPHRRSSEVRIAFGDAQKAARSISPMRRRNVWAGVPLVVAAGGPSDQAEPELGASRRSPDVFGLRQPPHPAQIPRELAGSSRSPPRIPATARPKRPFRAGIPAYHSSAPKRQDRPVTPAVAGSSPVAPVSEPLVERFFAQGFAGASTAREVSG